MKVVVHIMPYDSVHLVLSLIRRFSQEFSISDVGHEFVLYGIRNDEKNTKYVKLERDLSIVLKYIESERALSLFLRAKKNCSILIHGDSFPCIKQSIRANRHVSWICWGYIPQKGNKFILSDIAFILRKRIYQKLKNIVCLLSGDKNELVRLYKLTNILVLPYCGTNNDVKLEKYRFGRHSHEPLNVYIGNSGHVYQSYLDLLPQLAKYKGLIKVHVMFQYPDWPERKEIVRGLGYELFGDDFVLDETLLDIESYYHYISQCDVYICGDRSQTGLGAIQFCLFVGTKVFITGKNLEWIRELGAVVYDVDDIKNMSYSAFSRNLLPEEKELNKRVMMELWDQRSRWVDFLMNRC